MIKKVVLALIALAAVFSLSACMEDDADVVSENISTEADNFKIPRRIVGINGITDKFLMEIVGYCNIHVDTAERQLEVTCKVDGGYVKHFLGMSDNAPYTVEQLEAARVSPDFYKVVYKPSTLIPDIELR
jgi:hypothetical protein